MRYKVVNTFDNPAPGLKVRRHPKRPLGALAYLILNVLHLLCSSFSKSFNINYLLIN